MILEILKYPNSILRQTSKKVLKFDSNLHTLLDNMQETMLSYNGVGLAGVQVGKLLNVLIINFPIVDDDGNETYLEDNWIEAINPSIKILNNEQKEFEEGCLSIPDFTALIKRASQIEVTYYNRNGKKITTKADDLEAIAWQHECDHLVGKVYIDNLDYTKRKKFEKEYAKMNKQNAKNKNT
jgi:peptide deformylase